MEQVVETGTCRQSETGCGSFRGGAVADSLRRLRRSFRGGAGGRNRDVQTDWHIETKPQELRGGQVARRSHTTKDGSFRGGAVI